MKKLVACTQALYFIAESSVGGMNTSSTSSPSSLSWHVANISDKHPYESELGIIPFAFVQPGCTRLWLVET